MRVSDIIKCERVRGVFSTKYGKPAEYTATTINDCCRQTRSTRNDALEATAKEMLNQVACNQATYYWSPDNTVWIFYYAGSWCYDMLSRDLSWDSSFIQHGCRACTVILSAPDMYEALSQMIKHKNEYDRDLYCPRRPQTGLMSIGTK